MIIKKIRSENFGPYEGEQDIELNEGVYSVVCEYIDNPNRSNRGGKTSFIEMVLYGLYGEVRGGNELQFIHTNTEKMSVWLTLDDNGEEFSIFRSRDSKNNGELEVLGAVGSSKSDSQKLIDQKLGVGLNDFLLSFYFKQADIDAFFKAKITERKKILGRWFEKEYWKTYEEKAKDSLAKLNNKITTNEFRRSELSIPYDMEALSNERSEKSKVAEDLDKELTVKQQYLQQLEIELREKTDTRKYDDAIKSLLAQINLISKQSDSFISNIERYKHEILNKQLQLEEKNKNEVQLNYTLAQVNDGYNGDEVLKQVDALRSELSQVATLGKVKREEFEKIEKFGGVCPFTSQPCGSATNVDERKVALKVEMDTLRSRYAVVQKFLTTAEEIKKKHIALMDAVTLLKIKIASCKVNEQEKIDLYNLATQDKEKLDVLKIDLEAKNKEIEALKVAQKNVWISEEAMSLDKKIGVARQELSTIKTKLTEVQTQLSSITYKFEEVDRKKANLKLVEDELVKQYKDREDLTFIVYMFSGKGIVSRQIENSIEEIEKETNAILDRLSTNMQIEFQSEKELSTWEDNCVACGSPFPKGSRGAVECKQCGVQREKKRKDDLGVYVLENGTRRAYELDSGGGQTLICFAFRNAISKLLQKNLNCNWDVIILDEILGALDDVNAQEVTNAVLHFLRVQFGFKQIFMISHKKELQDVGNIIRIKRDAIAGRSMYEVVK